MKKDPRRIPVRNGLTYCSPACGCNCKHADYLAAKKDSSAIAAKLGEGWKAHVWENTGWHWRVSHSKAKITVDKLWKATGYTAEFQKEYRMSNRLTGVLQLYASHKDPVRAVQRLLEKMESFALDMMDVTHNLHGTLPAY